MESNAKEPNRTKNQVKSWIFLLLSVSFFLFLDQITKYLAVVNLKDKNAFVIIKGVFEFTYFENIGAAFSMLEGKGIFLVLATCVVLAYLLFTYPRIPLTKHYFPLRLIFSLLVSGAIGNMIDRIANHYVVDFIYFRLINFPVFNVADCFVTVAVILIALYGFLFYRGDELDFLLTFRKKQTKDKDSE